MLARPQPGSPGAGTTRSPDASRVQVTVVESDGCHFCVDARRVLADAAADFPVEVSTVDVRSPEGEDLMRAYRATMSPLVLVDGQFFSNGRLPRRKLAKVLRQRFTEPVPTGGAATHGGVHHG